MINKLFERYICCSDCLNKLFQDNSYLICKICGKKYKMINTHIIKCFTKTSPDLDLTINKWDKIYRRQLDSTSYYCDYYNYNRDYFQDTYDQLNKVKTINKRLTYLEIGCGPFFLGQELAKKVDVVIGIDICQNALQIAEKMCEEKGIKNYILIQGDINNIPIKMDKIDLIYGGGVIEHFKNTQQCVNELYRVLKRGGISFNTVPYLNIGALIYRQFRGNIPNFPILREIAEFLHFKVFKGKYAPFGYELSFLGTTISKIHKNAGFKEINIGKFDVKLVLDPFPHYIRSFLNWLANSSRLFWPMIKIIAYK